VSRLPIALVAAVARNGVIGADNKLVWKLSTDLKRLRALTWGKPFITGRKSFESIGRPLPGRDMIVVTRNADFTAADIRVVADIEAALALAEAIGREKGADEIIVAGGGEIYREIIARADRLYITEVDLAPEGDVHFPAIDPTLWREAKRERGVRGERDEAEFSYVDYVRRGL
jgi:dihydrofolate reductase